jgi:hypothetical protein
MIHDVGIPVHHFRGADHCGLHLVIEAVRLFVSIKFAAANTAEDNEKDVSGVRERAAVFRPLKQDWVGEIRPSLRLDPSAETLATATSVPGKGPRREGLPVDGGALGRRHEMVGGSFTAP